MKLIEEVEDSALVPTWSAILLACSVVPVLIVGALLVHRVNPASTWGMSPAGAGAICVVALAMLFMLLPGPIRALALAVAVVAAVVALRLAFP